MTIWTTAATFIQEPSKQHTLSALNDFTMSIRQPARRLRSSRVKRPASEQAASNSSYPTETQMRVVQDGSAQLRAFPMDLLRYGALLTCL